MLLNRKNIASICVFIYNVKRGISCELGIDDGNTDANDDTNNTAANNIQTLDTLTPLVNSLAVTNGGYIVDKNLMMLGHMDINMRVEDFGITILMMHFAEFYSNGQYPLFMNMFRCVKELEIIERFLLSYNQRSIKLPPNLATDREYGIKAQISKFTNNACLTIQTFNDVYSLMRNSDITPANFIECISLFHLSIIESFYIFTSITKNCKVINECHDLQHKSLAYTFQKPIKSLRYDGDYWFELPNKAIWFAYHMGRVKYSAYVSCDTNALMRIFKTANINYLIVGFLYENCLYPIILQDPCICGDWTATIERMKYLEFNCVFQSNLVPMPKRKTYIYFVKQSLSTIFKLI